MAVLASNQANYMKNTIKVIKFPKLLNKLIEKGHSEDRATKIILEAEQSSNPAYILNYYGIKISEVYEK